MTRSDHRLRHDRGLWAERLARLYLMCKGYRLLAKRYKTQHGEIDLIVTRGKILVFVEVKARKTYDIGLEAISIKAQQRIARAAQHFSQKNPRYRSHDMRFDAVVVRPRQLPYHEVDAWRL